MVTGFNRWILLCSFYAVIFISGLSLAETHLPSKINRALPSPLSNAIAKELPLTQSRWLLRSIKGKVLFPGTIITLEFKFPKIGEPYEFALLGVFKNEQHYDGVFTLWPNNRFTLKGCCQSQGNGAPEGTPEHDYIVTLYSIYSYKIKKEMLWFFDQQGKELLQYRKLPESKAIPDGLFGKAWRLVSANPKIDADLASFTLKFADKKPIKGLDSIKDWGILNQQAFDGTTSCQNYKGNYFAVESMLSVASLIRTNTMLPSLSELDLMALDKDIEANSRNENQVPYNSSQFKLKKSFDLFCSKKDILAKDTYLEMLRTVWHYEISETRLELYSDHGKRLVLEIINH